MDREVVVPVGALMFRDELLKRDAELMQKAIDAFDLLYEDLEGSTASYILKSNGFQLLETQINKMEEIVG